MGDNDLDSGCRFLTKKTYGENIKHKSSRIRFVWGSLQSGGKVEVQELRMRSEVKL